MPASPPSGVPPFEGARGGTTPAPIAQTPSPPGASPVVRGIVAVGAVLVVAAAFGGAYLMGSGLLIAFLAVVLATAAQPAVDGLGRVMPRKVGAFVVLGGGLVLVVGSISLVIPRLAEQLGALLDQMPARCQSIKDWSAADIGGGMARKAMGGLMPQNCAGMVTALPKRLAGWRSIVWVDNALWLLLVVAAMAYWWLLERARLTTQLSLFFSTEARPRVREFIDDVETRVGAFVRGQLIICGVVGVAIFATYLVVGVPAPLALAALAGVAELVPIVGPPVAALVAIVSAPHAWPVILIAAVVVRLTVDYLLTPLVMERAVGVNALIVLASLVALAKLGGVAGAMVAVPFAAIAQLAVNRWVSRTAAIDGLRAEAGRDRASTLRYQAVALELSARKLARHRRERSVVEIEEEVELIAGGLIAHLRANEPVEDRSGAHGP